MDKASAIISFDIGKFLDELKRNFIAKETTGSFNKYLKSNGIVIADSTQRKYRRYYTFYFKYKNLLYTGYNYSELYKKIPQIQKALRLYPDYKNEFMKAAIS